MTQTRQPIRDLMRRYGGHVVMALLGALLGISMYRNGIAVSLRNFADAGITWAIFAGVGVYIWIAGRFLDRLASPRRWQPFARDYFNLAAFLVIVPAVVAGIYFSILLPINYLAETMAP